MELNACVIIESFNIPNTASLEDSGDTRTTPPTPPSKGYTYRRNMELNACGISASYDVHDWNIQHPILIYT